jgi:hypothetical protein
VRDLRDGESIALGGVGLVEQAGEEAEADRRRGRHLLTPAEITFGIPGRPKGPNPEPMNTALSGLPAASPPIFRRPCSWVPGSSLRDAPE